MVVCAEENYLECRIKRFHKVDFLTGLDSVESWTMVIEDIFLFPRCFHFSVRFTSFVTCVTDPEVFWAGLN